MIGYQIQLVINEVKKHHGTVDECNNQQILDIQVQKSIFTCVYSILNFKTDKEYSIICSFLFGGI